ncbi:E3 ubiquitin-protein ligase hrd1 [Lithohypha guttulata]|uniref:RING-type E3 ubiquitin transferase n=1 Tax=Lithohypha guttulata TaxID=1690604 RepID=A0AAN7YIW4_9EURO|nr:E3 ubiquitin-protein ligase hrd1 [Lithohypha guttulata]KAK5106313.1 E3 ubiquitin-protein ligase hrd1 [Lithohypha guttulata]
MPPRPGAMRNRWTAYAGLSTTLAAGVILKALAQRPNFYSAAVYLSQSSANLMILCNLVFVTACTIVLFLQKLLYGPLRPIEVEQLYEKAWFAVTETCLAMTIFRGEIGAWFLVMFFSLLAGKVWGWIGEGRVEVLEQQQHNVLGGRNARLFHTRLAMSLALSVCFDLSMLEYIVGQVLHMARPDMMVMFGFEFAVLSISSLSTALRYALNLVEIGIVRKQKQKRINTIRKERIAAAIREVDSQQTSSQEGVISTPTDEPELTQRRAQAAQAAASQPIDEADVEVEGWDGKGRWVFYLDLTTDFCKLIVYLSFFFILLIFYGLPLHIMRDVFLTCRSFFKRIGDFLRYRTATRDMNQRYPDANEAEIGREDVCIICREEMRPYVPPAQGSPADPVAERMRPKKLPCGHVLHFSCLRSWLERQQICPTCRATVVPTTTRPDTVGGQGAPARPQHPPNAGNLRPRVFQLGPLRIGMGVARGNNMFEDLQDQLVNPAPAQGQNLNPLQQYGIGIRWEGMRNRAQGQRRHARGSVDDQLNAAERQIQRELDSLQASMGELQSLRQIQAQLARIRMARQTAAAQNLQPIAQTAPQPFPQVRTALPTITALAPAQYANLLQSGSDELPQGLTLPEGWTMMPLRPIQPAQMPGPAAFQGFPQPHQFANMQPQQFPVNAFGMSNVPQNNVINPEVGSEVSTHNSEQTLNALQPNIQQREAQQAVGEATPATAPTTSTPHSDVADPAQGAPSVPAPIQAEPEVDASTVQPPATQPRQAPVQSQPSRDIQPTQPRPQPSTTRPPQSSPRSSTTSAQTSRPRQPPNSTPTAPSSSLLPTSLQQRLNPVASNSNRTISPHRPTRSIGSSWGFAGAEGDNESESDTTTESEDEDEDEEDDKVVLPQTLARANGTSSRPSNERQQATGKAKNATVEDLSDPD